jgi:hypothetical protein
LPQPRVVGTALIAAGAFALGLVVAGHPALAARDQPQPPAHDQASFAPSERAHGVMASCADRIHDRLFFGLGTADGSVSSSHWGRFLNEVVTPRFPGGLTVVEASGQWRAHGEREITIERSRVVEIAHDDSPEVDRRIEEVVAIYKHRHRQRAVMLTRARVQVCW